MMYKKNSIDKEKLLSCGIGKLMTILLPVLTANPLSAEVIGIERNVSDLCGVTFDSEDRRILTTVAEHESKEVLDESSDVISRRGFVEFTVSSDLVGAIVIVDNKEMGVIRGEVINVSVPYKSDQDNVKIAVVFHGKTHCEITSKIEAIRAEPRYIVTCNAKKLPR